MGLHSPHSLQSPSRRRCLQALAWGGLAGVCAPLRAQSPTLPPDSIYQLQAPLTDQDGRNLGLDFNRGAPLLVSMFYASCDGVCPMIFQTLKLSLAALPEADAARLKLLLISFDPARDSPTQLKLSAQTHGCDARWTLARSDEAYTRQIAALLGVQYRRLASGEFNHSSLIELLDAQGRIVARSTRLGSPDPALLSALRRQLSAPVTV